MKLSIRLSILSAASLFACTLNAQEQVAPGIPAPESAPGMQTDEKPSDAALLKRFDKNGDGKLDDSEKAAAKLANLEAGDGPRAKIRERAKSRIAEFDKNGDGTLDEAERAEMEKANRAATEKNKRLMKRLDTDGDGKLSDAEWSAAKEKVRERAAEKAGK